MFISFTQHTHRLVLILFIAGCECLWGNNITVSGASISGRNISAGTNNSANYTVVQFDLTWENSWRYGYASGINNWDAAWVFVKYRYVGGEWKHAQLGNTGYETGSGTASVIETGLLNPSSAYNASTNPVLGVFISRSDTGMGTFTQTAVKIRWNYGMQNIPDDSVMDIKVFAVEMVYVPQGYFYAGSGGTDTLGFTVANSTTGNTVPLKIATTLPTLQGNNASSSSSNLSARGAWDLTSTTTASLAAGFPTGYGGFYCMKYELTQKQWIDFFNMLTAAQKTNRDITSTARPAGTGDYNNKRQDGLLYGNNISWSSGDATLPTQSGVADAFGDTGCNFLNWPDMAAFSDWAGLRPMTELEFEKACRGPLYPIANAYAWGSTAISRTASSVSDAGANNETVSANYSTASGNAHNNTSGALSRPWRAGIYAANSASTGSISSGATYYGITEMSGNLMERTVYLGDSKGRLFTGEHGNGTLTVNGNADAANWPGLYGEVTGGKGIGPRCGNWMSTSSALQISARGSVSDTTITLSTAYYGYRAVRTRTCTGPSGSPGSITGSATVAANTLQSYSTSGGSSYLWILPLGWSLVSGQGSGSIKVVTGTTGQSGTIRAAFVNDCGAGTETTLTVTVN